MFLAFVNRDAELKDLQAAAARGGKERPAWEPMLHKRCGA
jgi:hypothetical protein